MRGIRSPALTADTRTRSVVIELSPDCGQSVIRSGPTWRWAMRRCLDNSGAVIDTTQRGMVLITGWRKRSRRLFLRSQPMVSGISNNGRKPFACNAREWYQYQPIKARRVMNLILLRLQWYQQKRRSRSPQKASPRLWSDRNRRFGWDWFPHLDQPLVASPEMIPVCFY